MIYDTISNIGKYRKLCARIVRAAEFAGKMGKGAPDGRHEIDGERMYAVVSTYRTKMDGRLPFEGHRKYIDFQRLLSGRERIDVIQGTGFRVKERYSAARDVRFVYPPERCSSIILTPGAFALLYPHDLHRPGMGIGRSGKVRKLVVKISVR